MEPLSPQLQEALITVWQQALDACPKTIQVGDRTYPVRKTRSGLIQIDFTFEGREVRALEQNPKTRSRWAALARAGHRVMQFLEQGRYIANVSDGKLTVYGRILLEDVAGASRHFASRQVASSLPPVPKRTQPPMDRFFIKALKRSK